MNHEEEKRVWRVVAVVSAALVIGAIWFLTLQYNLEGGFKKKLISNAPNAAALGSNQSVEEEIKLFKANFAASRRQLEELLHPAAGRTTSTANFKS